MPVSVKEIVIPKDRLENIQKIQKSKLVWFTRREKLKAAAGFNAFCCVCHEISSPSYQVKYSTEGVVRVEMYCSNHMETYHKTKNRSSKQLAAKYNCQIGEVPHTIPNPWD